MSDLMANFVGIVLVSGILFVALKFGFIGGGGISVERSEEPVLFWMSVALNVAMLITLVVVLIYSLFAHS